MAIDPDGSVANEVRAAIHTLQMLVVTLCSVTVWFVRPHAAPAALWVPGAAAALVGAAALAVSPSNSSTAGGRTQAPDPRLGLSVPASFLQRTLGPILSPQPALCDAVREVSMGFCVILCLIVSAWHCCGAEVVQDAHRRQLREPYPPSR